MNKLDYKNFRDRYCGECIPAISYLCCQSEEEIDECIIYMTETEEYSKVTHNKKR